MFEFGALWDWRPFIMASMSSLISAQLALAGDGLGACSLEPGNSGQSISDLSFRITNHILEPRKGPEICRVESLINCEIFRSSQQPFIESGGSLVPNLTTNGSGYKKEQISNAELETAKLTFDRTKQKMIGLILRGRDPATLTGVDRSMYLRLSTVSYRGLIEGSFCDSSRPNADYDSETHSVGLCPTYLKLPEISLVRVLAHEIAHAIDPCHMHSGFYQTPSTVSSPARYFASSPLAERMSKSILEIRKDIADGKLIEIATPTNSSEFPFNDVLLCLEQKKGKPQPRVPSYEDCSYRRTTAGEDMADFLSASIVGQFLDETPMRSTIDRQMFFYETVGEVCRTTNAEAKKPKSGGFNHSSDSFRANEIFLANPSIRRAFGCQSDTKSCSIRDQ